VVGVVDELLAVGADVGLGLLDPLELLDPLDPLELLEPLARATLSVVSAGAA
jgi:hypothetical protein